MRLVHIADTHFGKQLKKVNFAEVDQPYWLEQFLARMEEVKPKVVVVAGDIFDVKMPAQEATKLWDQLLEGLIEKGIQICAVPGNHDLSARVGEKAKLLSKVGLHLSGRLEKTMPCVTFPQPDGQKVKIWLLSYLTPEAVRGMLERKDILEFNEALKEYMAVQEINYEEINVLVAHQNVMDCGSTDDRALNEEELSRGFSGAVDWRNFEGFDYVALGHIHAAQHVGTEYIRFAGAPLQYDFSEEGRWRGFMVIDITGKGQVTITKEELAPLHQLVVFPKKGQPAASLEQLLAWEKTLTEADKAKTYIKLRLQRKEYSPEAHKQLEEVYGPKLLDVEPVVEDENTTSIDYNIEENLSLDESFRLYFEQVNQQKLTPEQLKVVLQAVSAQEEDKLLTFTGGPKSEAEKHAYKLAGDALFDFVGAMLEKEGQA